MDGLFENESLRVCMIIPTGTVTVVTRALTEDTASLHFNQSRPTERLVFNMGVDSAENTREAQLTDGLYCLTGGSSNHLTTLMDLQVYWRP